MLISRNISIATAAALGLAAAPAAALAAGGAEVVDSADAFAAEAEADAAESRLADLVPTGGLQARWRVRAPSAGSQRWYQRLDWQPATGWAAHLLVERDPGEARWNDYTSAYLDWRGRRGSVTVGDLRPGFGQGLVFGRSGARGGASRPGPRGDRTCAGYRSTAESGAVRGVLVPCTGGRPRWRCWPRPWRGMAASPPTAGSPLCWRPALMPPPPSGRPETGCEAAPWGRRCAGAGREAPAACRCCR